MSKRLVYLAGAVELEDTWRERAGDELATAGYEPINPLRGENSEKIQQKLVVDVTPELIVARDLLDLDRVRRSGGICLMHFKSTDDGRRPTATLCEMMWFYMNHVPIVAVIGPKCCAYLRDHPWVKVMVTHRETSLTGALDLIESYFT
jgi:hypothetical protein